MANLKVVSTASWDKDVKTSKVPVLVEFSAPG